MKDACRQKGRNSCFGVNADPSNFEQNISQQKVELQYVQL